jgi:microsomal dipeptidase-like Zn-dependent dipeptidase
MNRIGMLVDLSHTSDDTAVQALQLSRAPVMWSHSSVRALRGISRNVPDHILKMIGTGKGQKDGVVMVRVYFRLRGRRTQSGTISRLIYTRVFWWRKVAKRRLIRLQITLSI